MINYFGKTPNYSYMQILLAGSVQAVKICENFKILQNLYKISIKYSGITPYQ